MKTIYKYPLEVSKRNWIEIPIGWEARLFAEQNGVPTLWAEVDTTNPKYLCSLLIVKTGTDIGLGSKTGNSKDVSFVDSCIIGKNVLFLHEDCGGTKMGEWTANGPFNTHFEKE